jgi:thiamine pyrophosphokinase
MDTDKLRKMNGKGVCYIVGAGDNYGLTFRPGPEDLVIAADAGLRYLEEAGIRCDRVVGDLDSLRYMPDFPRVLRLPEEKDVTDTWAAVAEGIVAGYDRFLLYCATGGRIDHTIANIQLIAHLAENGRVGVLFDRDTAVTSVRNGALTFPAGLSGYVSVFAAGGPAKRVSIRGLKYELADATLTTDYPLGVSNEFTGSESMIAVGQGTLIVTFPSKYAVL